MKIACVALLAACTTTTPATDPELSFTTGTGPWFLGEANKLTVNWPPAMSCTNDGWDCETGPAVDYQIDHVTCTGCTVGKLTDHDFEFTANTTDAISIAVDVSAGGDKRHLVATGVGDREIELVASCSLVWSQEIEGVSELTTWPCGETRGAEDDIVLDWHIRTLRGERVPFCPDGATCQPNYSRKTSMIQLSAAPQLWWGGTVPIFSSIDTSTLTITVPLADGSPSSATIAIPPIQLESALPLHKSDQVRVGSAR